MTRTLSEMLAPVLRPRQQILPTYKEECVWPIGEVGHVDYHSCGRATSSKVYCPFHDRIAHAPR